MLPEVIVMPTEIKLVLAWNGRSEFRLLTVANSLTYSCYGENLSAGENQICYVTRL